MIFANLTKFEAIYVSNIRFYCTLFAIVLLMFSIENISASDIVDSYCDTPDMTISTIAKGDYSIDYSTGDPTLYDIYLPGDPSIQGYYIGRENTPINDASCKGAPGSGVESLSPHDMALGQIVPFQFAISVDEPPTCLDGDCITITAQFRTKTTNGGDFGYDPFYGAIAAFVDAGDPNASGDTDANVTSLSWSVINLNTNNEAIEVEFEVCGLDATDEKVVAEVWMVLKNTIPPGISGNVQSNLESAITSGCTEDGQSISTGNQTVPLLQPSEFYSADVDLAIVVDDSVYECEDKQIEYTLTVTNNGPDVANSIVITNTLDPNVSFVSTTLPCASAHDGSATGGQVSCDIGALTSGDSKSFTILVDVASSSPHTSTVDDDCSLGGDLINNVSITTISDDRDASNDSDCEPSDILECFSSPLPVEFTFIRVNPRKAKCGTVDITWKTEFEINNEMFVVERSIGASNTFEKVGIVESRVNSDVKQNYRFVDEVNKVDGSTTIYYRIKQVDLDGEFTYSKIASTKLDCSASEINVNVFPNPAVTELFINIQGRLDDVSRIVVFNALGQIVDNIPANQSSYYTHIDVSNYATGLHFVKVLNNSEEVIVTEKVFVTK